PYRVSVANPTDTDSVNNVEGVYVSSPVAGRWTIRVRGADVPGRPGFCEAPCSQGYALVASGRWAGGASAAHALTSAYNVSGGCDDDPFLDNGERVTLNVTVKNYGVEEAWVRLTPAVAADSDLPESAVVLPASAIEVGVIPAGGSAAVSFPVRFLHQPSS